MTEHVRTGDPTPLRLIGAEYDTEVAEAGGAEQRITECMRCNVTVRMPGATVGIGEQQAQQPTRSPYLYRMYIGTQTDAQIRH